MVGAEARGDDQHPVVPGVNVQDDAVTGVCRIFSVMFSDAFFLSCFGTHVSMAMEIIRNDGGLFLVDMYTM